jgi:hypothetical protein
LISPSTPRAIYFNDDVYVAWVQNASMLEVASVDPQYGTIFYVIDQTNANASGFSRLTQPCMSCHGPARDDVPSPLLLVMSVATMASGEPIGDFSLITDRTPLAERWGGWYVTASREGSPHKGNKVIAADGGERPLFERSAALRPVDTSRYLATSSDIVALMLLSHQVDVHNRMSETAHEIRFLPGDASPSQLAEAVEPVVRSLLFSGAAPFPGPTLSYLIYSDSFDRLPTTAREYVYRRLWEVFSGKDRSDEFKHLSEADRATLAEILTETKPEFAAWVRKTNGQE